MSRTARSGGRYYCSVEKGLRSHTGSALQSLTQMPGTHMKTQMEFPTVRRPFTLILFAVFIFYLAMATGFGQELTPANGPAGFPQPAGLPPANEHVPSVSKVAP